MAKRATPATVNRRAQARQVDEVLTGSHCMPALAPRHTGFPQAGLSPHAGPPADASRAERATRAFEAFGGALVPYERSRRFSFGGLDLGRRRDRTRAEVHDRRH